MLDKRFSVTQTFDNMNLKEREEIEEADCHHSDFQESVSCHSHEDSPAVNPISTQMLDDKLKSNNQIQELIEKINKLEVSQYKEQQERAEKALEEANR